MSASILPRASVIIPAYNASRHIGQTLASVRQTISDDAVTCEVIVVDDGSTDDTADIVRRDFPEVTLIRTLNGGPGAARNTGVRSARCEILVFQDADDLMLPGRLGHQVSYMEAHPEISAAFGSEIPEQDPDFCKVRAFGLADSDDYHIVKNAYARLISEQNIVTNTASAARRSAYLAVGGQPEDVMVAEDYAFYMLLARYYPIAASGKRYIWYRQGHGTNLMASNHVTGGEMTVLFREILFHSHSLDPRLRVKANQRFNVVFNRYARRLWAYRGTNAVSSEAERCRCLLSPWMIFKWTVLAPCTPPAVGRVVQQGKHWVRRQLRAARGKA